MAVPLTPGVSESLALGSALLLPLHGDLPDLSLWSLLPLLPFGPAPGRPCSLCLSLLPLFVRSLRGNSLGLAGAKAVASALRVNRSLRRLR